MKLLKQALAVLGSLVVIALLAALAAPQSTHAVVATLVQIAPGATTHVGQNESQFVSLHCNPGSAFCAAFDASGGEITYGYYVPPGSTLIITDYEWESTILAAPGVLVCDQLINTTFTTDVIGSFNCSIADNTGRAFGQVHYTTGVRLGGGAWIADNGAAGSQATAYIQGYLVPN
jgi:hypothetical protein